MRQGGWLRRVVLELVLGCFVDDFSAGLAALGVLNGRADDAALEHHEGAS